jgi:hypothetical protein
MQVTYKLTKTRGVQTKMSPHTKANSPQSMALRRTTCVLVRIPEALNVMRATQSVW